MSKRQQPSRGSTQEFAKSAQNTPNKVRNSENKTPKTSKKAMTTENPEEISKIDELYTMMKSVMAKLETLDLINERILSVEQNVKSLTKSIEFSHAEVTDLKEEMKQRKRTEENNETRIGELEESNKRLQETVVDLKARSMRDNLLFHNIEESDEENCAEVIYSLLEEKLDMPDARQNIKIDRAHRVGRKRDSRRKPRAIVAKFNFFPDREKIRRNARKLKGTRIGISEQFPEEIEKVRQKLYPEMRRAKAEKQRVRLVRDKLFINNVEFIPDNS
jgi:tRNA threonylcarbamoyladenosine modification (KEOPS) complex  Pcc1 subunit